MPRALLLATTTGYQTRSFDEAAEASGIDLVYATDRCHLLDDPWRDGAIPIRFHDEDQSVDAIVAAARTRPVNGILPLGDRPTVIAARAARALGLPGNPPAAAFISRHKRATRERLAARGLSSPWFRELPFDCDIQAEAKTLQYPCVVKPMALSGSRGVIRADGATELVRAFDRVRRLLQQTDVLVLRDPANEAILVEAFVEGREVALEGLLEHGRLRVLAIFDKPDPLDGPFFEETIYLTPSRLPAEGLDLLVGTLTDAIGAIGLIHGPIHAECRVSDAGVTVLEVAARPIGGLCARALRFVSPEGQSMGLEELLLRHAIGQTIAPFEREPAASGVMMLPIPRRGVYRRTEGLERAKAVAGVTDVVITVKVDQALVPLPEGASYLGFIFARDRDGAFVEQALRTAHHELSFVVDPSLDLA